MAGKLDSSAAILLGAPIVMKSIMDSVSVNTFRVTIFQICVLEHAKFFHQLFALLIVHIPINALDQRSDPFHPLLTLRFIRTAQPEGMIN